MKVINQYIKSNILPDKSPKSIWKILNGSRTQQTYFDAVMQNLLPVYEIYPDLSLATVDNFVNKPYEGLKPFHLYPYFHYASEVSFKALVLLIQSVSEYLYQSTDYLPSTNRLFIQRQVKMIFKQIKEENLFIILAEELEHLIQYVEEKVGTFYFIYLFAGHNIRATSIETLSSTLNVESEVILSQLFIEKNAIVHALKTENFTILNRLYARTPLHMNTLDTYQRLKAGRQIEEVMKEKHVRIHTIQDHIVEILIKDYPLDVSDYITKEEFEKIKLLLDHNRFGKLKAYYETSEIQDYFKLKLAIVINKMGQSL
ncbi:helix-turn-helix domain-containing protein [Macrococcoides caseolyticum]|uniref:helix-turn-helix domain-containing protein n=1 Tax=Macrococcoides caseolyticum TaxID=69966 RepID=UPI001F2B66A1|nr:helix-turn-helix domain-containing protein [Macrococcus caseolyticus]MCE4957086.1 helix-turn-helix domain-containing protein [Macrococcus caseolyticus]